MIGRDSDFSDDIDWGVYKSQQNAPASAVAMSNQMQGQEEGKYRQDIPIGGQSGQPSGVAAGLMKIPGQLANAAAHPLDTLQDVGAGVMGGAQRLAATMGEAGQGIASFLTGGYAPRVDIREELGLGKNNPVHLEDVLASKNNNPLAKAIGQYGMGVASGGRSLLGQVASNAGWGATQAEPGERLQAAAEGAATAAIPFGLAKGAKAVKAGYQYVKPAQDAEALVNQLGRGAKTAEENVNQLANSIKEAHAANVEDALQSKQAVMDAAGKEFINPQQSAYVNKGNATHLYDSDLKELHDNFLNNPTFENADKLQSQLGDEIGYYQRLASRDNLAPADKPKLTELKKARDYLNKDQDDLLQSLSPDLKAQYRVFKDKWKQNVVPYKSSQTLRDIIKDGDQAGITRSQINKEFAFPDKNINKISSDIGQEGKDRILFNEIQGAKQDDVGNLANAILNAKKMKGMSSYVSPEVESAAQNLNKRATASKYYETAKAGAQGAALGSIAGVPLIGAGLGVTLKHGLPLAKYLAKHLKK
ncbi:MAG: hypothetical protein PHV62_03200 [Sulfuricurvum sp.]|nr:hypothetical protein [Sulfuricurvum sp.]